MVDDQAAAGWPTCVEPGCQGVRLGGGEHCLAHLADERDFRLLVRGQAGDGLDARGVRIDAALWARIAEATFKTDDGRPLIRDARFAQATFEGAALEHVTFEGTSFRGAVFRGSISFQRTQFRPSQGNPTFGADFLGATFDGATAGFDDATFAGPALFTRARFAGGQVGGGGTFRRARFLGAAEFGHSEFHAAETADAQAAGLAFGGRLHTGAASFAGATFQRRADFASSTFAGHAQFDGATFAEVSFDDAVFRGYVSFEKASFTGAANFRARFDGAAWFADARFAGDTSFARAMFTGDAGFSGATFTVTAWFNHATFRSLASFRNATFAHEARFESARCDAAAWFDDATFVDHARFNEARFVGDAQFADATFRAMAIFRKATFAGDIEFDRASFADSAWFDAAMFDANVQFHDATFGANAGFEDARFRRSCYLGPVLVLGTLRLDGVTFEDAVQLVISADAVSCMRTRFRDRALLELRWAEVALDRAEFARPAIVTAASATGEFDEEPLLAICHGRAQRLGERAERDVRDRGRDEIPRMVSLRRADVANLTLSDVDLRACRFDGAHNLPSLRIEGTEVFERTPRSYGGTRRQAIAEEHAWRHDHPRRLQSRGWNPPTCALPDWLSNPYELEPTEIAAIYRDLRKGREDNKDEPGAADFYYGEMEMRRYSGVRAPLPERVVVSLYWLVSGYGLRASRALLALLLTVVLFALFLYTLGLKDRDVSVALLQSLDGAAFRAGDKDLLTEGGQYLQLPLRFLGPLFLGLTIVSLRGRVKR